MYQNSSGADCHAERLMGMLVYHSKVPHWLQRYQQLMCSGPHTVFTTRRAHKWGARCRTCTRPGSQQVCCPPLQTRVEQRLPTSSLV